MTDLLDLLERLREARVRISEVDGELRYSGPPATLTESIAADIRKHGDDLVDLLRRTTKLKVQPASLPGTDSTSYTASLIQQRLWLVARNSANAAAFNLPVALRVTGRFEPDLLREAFQAVVRAHDILTASFGDSDGQLIVRPEPGRMPEQQFVDLSLLPPAARDERLHELIRQCSAAPFDFEAGCLLRLCIARLDETDHAVVLVFSHMIADAASIQLFARDLEAAYGAALAGERPDIAPRQYRDFVGWQQHHSKAFADRLPIVAKSLGGRLPVLRLATDRPRPKLLSLRGQALDIQIETDLLAQLRASAQKQNCSLFVLMLAVFKLLLHRYSGQSDLIVGCPNAGRPLAVLRQIIGPCANIIAVRTQLDLDEPFADLLKRLQRTVLDGLVNEVPFELVVRAIRPERTANQTPIFQVMFNLEGGVDATTGLRLGDASTRLLPVETGAANFDLHMSLFETVDSISGTLLYSEDIFDSETVRAIASGYVSLLRTVVGASDMTARQILQPVVTVKTNVVLAANFYAEPLGELLQSWITRLHLPIELQVLPPDQIMQILIDNRRSPGAGSGTFRLIVLEESKWAQWLAQGQGETGGRESEFVQYVKEWPAKGPDVAVAVLPPPGDSSAVTHALDEFIDRLNEQLPGTALDLRDLAAHWPVDDAGLGQALEPDEIIYSDSENLAISTALARRLSQQFLPIIKVIVLDCDYTLWDGACADQPPETLHLQAGHLALQEFMLQQVNSGRLLCLCSRNTEAHVLDAFAKTPGMRLTLEHVTAHRINHRPKSQNIMALASELNLGLDAFVFIDDDPLECSEVESACPAVWTLQLPRDPTSYQAWLERLWILDVQPTTAEGAARTKLYRQQAQRIQAAQRHATVGELLEALQLTVDIHEQRGPNWQRIVELTQRTNQFNPYKHALRVSELAEQVSAGHWWAWEVTATDRFGSFGVIGAIVMLIRERTAIVEQFTLSCRAFSRGIEYRMARFALDWAESQGLESVLFRFAATPSNLAARIFLLSLQAGSDRDGAPPAEWLLTRAAGRHAVDQAEAAVLQRPISPAQADETPNNPAAASTRSERRDGGMRELPAALENPDATRRFLGLRRMPSGMPAAGPTSPTEQRLGALVAEFLDADDIASNTNLFAAGADSLLLLRLAAACRNLGWDLRLGDFLEYQTVGELAVVLRSRTAATASEIPLDRFALLGATDRTLVSRQHPDVVDAYPISGMQAGMVFHAARDPDAAIYQVIDSFRLRGRFDNVPFREALARVVERHAALRTWFDLSSFSEPLQLVAGTAALNLTVIDLRSQSDQDAQELFQAWLEHEQRRQFEADAPLVRYTVHQFQHEVFQLTITHHHAILDGWSLNGLVRELLETYLACSRGETVVSIAPPAPGYAAFVKAERDATACPRHQAFWRDRLGGVTVSRPNGRVAEGPLHPVVRPIGIPVELGAALAELGRRARLPLKSLLLAVHLAVIVTWTGRREVVSGVLFNGRLEAGQGDEVLGLFVNSLPLRAELRSGSWLDLARQAFDLEREAEPFRRLPLVQLQRLSGVAPLFEFMFTFTHFHLLNRVRDQNHLEVVDTYNFVRDNIPVHAFFDVNPFLPAEIRLLLNVDQSRLTSDEIETMARCYQAALRDIARNADSSWLAGTGRWHPSSRPLEIMASTDAAACSLDATFERQARLTPDRVAIIEGSRRVSYRELERSAAMLASALSALGASQQAIVGVACESGIETAIALLAIAKSGAAWLPIDCAWPQERQEWMLANAQAIAVIVDHAGPPLAGLATLQALGKHAPSTSAARRPLDPGRLAYVIYTSGSTGTPKAVMIPHDALTFLFAAARPQFGFEPGEIWTLFHSFAFDLSVWEFWAPFVAGGSLLLVQRDARREPEAFQQLLQRETPAVVSLTPSAIMGLLPDDNAKTLLSRCHGLRAVVAGGEALAGSLAAELSKLDVPLWNFYGPTEATVWTSIRAVSLGDDTETLGEPLPGADVLVFDEFDRQVRPGGSGVMQIAGPGLAWGYLRQPALTAQSFRPHASAATPGQRLYDTGDQVELASSGQCKFLGRRDHQVKLRGYRIELGEIAATVQRYPGIARAAVIAIEARDGAGIELACFFIGESGIGREELRPHLHRSLPEYMIPSHFIALLALPMTGNNKLDLAELRRLALQHRASAAGANTAPPATPVEELVASIWQQILGTPPLHRDADFFELGGDSIQAVQVTARIHQALGCTVPLRTLFDHACLRDYAATLQRTPDSAAAAWRALTELQPENGPAPLSAGQRGVWIADQLANHPATFNTPIVLKTRGRLDIELMRQNLWQVLTRHQVICSRIGLKDGQPFQERVAAESLDIGWLDLRGMEPAQIIDARARTAIRQLADQPFDLERGPLGRACIISTADDCNYLVGVIHHICCDGWSMVILRDEIVAMYRALSGDSGDLPSLPLQYSDYARWQDRWGKELWQPMLPQARQQLTGQMPPLLLPRSTETQDDGPVVCDIPTETVERLKALALEQHCTLFMVLLAAFEAVLTEATGQTDLWIGSAISNRDHPVLERLVGYLANMVVLRTDLTGSRSFRDLLMRVKTATLDAHERRHVPFEELVAQMTPRRDARQTRLHAVFELHNAPNQTLELPGVQCETVDIVSAGAKYERALLVQETPDGLHCVFEYDPRLHGSRQIHALLQRFCSVIAEVLQNIDTAIVGGPVHPTATARLPSATVSRWRQQYRGSVAAAAPRAAPGLAQPADAGPDLEQMPAVFEAGHHGTTMVSWLRQNREAMEQTLARRGALLFRGFGIDTAPQLREVAAAITTNLLRENGEHVPVAGIAGIQTPINYAHDRKLLWHNENTFNKDWPTRLLFACGEPATTGGETPLVDSRKVLAALPDEVKGPFLEHGVMYVRNYGRTVGRSWQSVFMTDERAEVEEKCRAAGFDFEWRADGGLRTACVRPAVLRHPTTGELSWCNQAQHWHPACLDEATRSVFSEVANDAGFPRHCHYGNGAAIPDDHITSVLQTYQKLEVTFTWQRGDLLILDNLLVAHARNPYRGARQIFVAMGDCISV
jgi:amino acid adenylation domain-containing protein/FkbH-like protein